MAHSLLYSPLKPNLILKTHVKGWGKVYGTGYSGEYGSSPMYVDPYRAIFLQEKNRMFGFFLKLRLSGRIDAR